LREDESIPGGYVRVSLTRAHVLIELTTHVRIRTRVPRAIQGATQPISIISPARFPLLTQLYGLYKQATVGDNNTDRPGAFNFKAKYKWDAWDKLKGKSQEEAEQEYIALVQTLSDKYN
jgi:diazepam-binding inhibitor (GABA receptor modulating acyl-CoA-binding protein)